MPFGLKNSPYEFSKMISQLLEEFEGFSVPYLDDIAIFSNSHDTDKYYLRHMSAVLRRIQKAGLTIKLSKCKYTQSEVKYIGHVVVQRCRKPTELGGNPKIFFTFY
ncbi:hypothetical protein AVEN_34629-1 [Araneus ventricosus]|uniref:Reverse transcriptase domain-containing protein n=1 Tax=Araneus ventricosus TaxID=182803 RepID=A0A4Y2B0B7_ARAVE|nr:hypothetical protein AVEN_34629-1 [Araneus ventricosus]